MSASPSYGTIDHEYGLRLATTPPEEDGPVWMVNLMKYRERAEYADGSDHGRSGRDADDTYAPLDVFEQIGAELVFVADVDQQLLGDDPVWDRVAVVKYATRRSFVEMQSRDDFQARHEHKEAGMDRTVVIGCQPIPTMSIDELEGVEMPEEVEHPSTPDDPAVVVLHVLKYEEGTVTTPDEMVAYQTAAARVAVRHGGGAAGWFGVEGTIIGDGRSWDQVRFNTFPSKRAFMAVVMDPERLAVQREHREAAVADTYTMILRPTLDRLAGSLP